MSELLSPLAEWCAITIELIGVAIITGFAIYTVIYAAIRLPGKHAAEEYYHDIRQHLARGILVGLEFLVAADIIHTVAVELSYKSVGVLAAILLIRTFLSFTLELEVTGNWPWQRKTNS